MFWFQHPRKFCTNTLNTTPHEINSDKNIQLLCFGVNICQIHSYHCWMNIHLWFLCTCSYKIDVPNTSIHKAFLVILHDGTVSKKGHKKWNQVSSSKYFVFVQTAKCGQSPTNARKIACYSSLFDVWFWHLLEKKIVITIIASVDSVQNLSSSVVRGTWHVVFLLCFSKSKSWKDELCFVERQNHTRSDYDMKQGSTSLPALFRSTTTGP